MAFALPIPGLDAADEDEFFVGNSIFNRGWVAAPASVEQFDGVGPLFNAVSCSGCHFKDGRGAPPEVEGEAFSALLLRLSVPGADEHGGPLPEPTYGGQVQGQAVRGVPAEARESVVYEEEAGTYGDGERYTLRRPRYAIAGAFGPLAPEVLVSPRVAPAMHGLGLLEAVPDAALEALADPDDRDGDGISGRVNRVWDVESKSTRVGRFGWKANQPSLRQQTAGAFVGDMGLTSSLFPEEECTPAQLACLAAPSGGAPELSESLLGSVVTYSRLLAVPARRKWKDATVLRGKALFAEARCTACHTPLLRTASDATPSRLAGVTLRPYTDLLLHDLGPDLADGRPDFEATGQEWRTPPLWGIGLVATVNRHTFLLHDGRARGFAEAILWHGGEAEPSRNAFRSMPKADRDALLAFLQSL
jgi:CxxC motif-containing protein (DUF1111 family)